MRSFFEELIKEELNDYQIKLHNESIVTGRLPHSYKEHDKLFGEDNDTKVFPLHKSLASNAVDMDYESEHGRKNRAVAEAVAKAGHEVVNFNSNIASKSFKQPDGSVRQRHTSISSVLARNGHNELLKHYDAHRGLQNHNDFEIVMTRKPHDITGVSTGRKWDNTSCLRLPTGVHDTTGAVKGGGIEWKNLHNEHKHGTIAAYLVHKGDHGIKNPISRIMVKRFVPSELHKSPNADTPEGFSKSIWRPEIRKAYGAKSTDFEESVKQLVSAHYPAAKKTTYMKHHEVYDDHEEMNTFHHSSNKSTRDNSFTKNSNGELHSIDGKPSMVTKTGYGYREATHFNGNRHSYNDKPSESAYGADNKPISHTWHEHGLEHRDGDKPAEILYHSGSNQPHHEHYKKYGELHRNPLLGAAHTTYSRTGEVQEQTHAMHGIEHRPVEHGASYTSSFNNDYRYKEYGKLKSPAPMKPSSVVNSHYGGEEVTFHDQPDGTNLKVSPSRSVIIHNLPNGNARHINLEKGKVTDSVTGEIGMPISDAHKEFYGKYLEASKAHLHKLP